jgi:hypothetical protein
MCKAQLAIQVFSLEKIGKNSLLTAAGFDTFTRKLIRPPKIPHHSKANPMNIKPAHWSVLMALLIFAGAAVFSLGVLMHFNVITDVSDGIMHYQIARFAPQHPYLFLDPWGKPLFTTLASLPAQLGFYGVVAFNLLVGGATVFFGLKLLPQSSWLGWSWPVWLLSSQLYFNTLLGGLTEPLFGLLLILALYFAQKQWWKALAIVLGLSFFSRPESVVLIPLGTLLLLHHKQWKAVLYIAVPFLLVSLMGWPYYKEFFWYITHQTYTGAKDIYGSGPWNFFLMRLPEIYGWPLLAGLGLMTLGAITKQPTTKQPTAHSYLLLAGLPALCILLLHSYLWWQGAKGSLGLLRVMATTTPAIVALLFFQIAKWEQLWPKLTRTVFFVMTLAAGYVAGVAYYQDRHSYIQPNPLQYQPKAVGAWLQAHQKENVVAFLHPLVGFFGNLNPEDTTQTQLIWRLRKQEPYLGLAAGDYLVWDAPHTPNEGNLKLEELLQHPAFEPIAYFPPVENARTLGDIPLEFFVFEAMPQARKLTTVIHQTDTLLWQKPEILGKDLYQQLPVSIEMPADSNFLYCEIAISGAIKVPENATVFAVLQQADENGLRLYRNLQLQADDADADGFTTFTLEARIAPQTAHLPFEVYLWNWNEMPITAKNLLVTNKRIFLAPREVTPTKDTILQPSK